MSILSNSTPVDATKVFVEFFDSFTTALTSLTGLVFLAVLVLLTGALIWGFRGRRS